MLKSSLLLPSLAGLFERFSFYGLRTLLILYVLTSDLPFGFNKISMLLGITIVIGILRPIAGFVTDRFLGPKRSVLIANGLIIAGTILLYFSLESLLFPGTALIILGSALFAPANLHILLSEQKNARFRTDSWMSLYFAFVTIGLYLGEDSLTAFTNQSRFESGIFFCLVSSICSLICAFIYRSSEKEKTNEIVSVNSTNNLPLISGMFIAILLFWIANSLTSLNFSFRLTQHSSNDFAHYLTALTSLLAGFLFFFLWRYVSIPTVYKWISGLILGGIVAFLPLLDNDFYNRLGLNCICIILLTISEILTGALTYSLLQTFSPKKYLTTIIGTALFFESVGAIIVYKWLPEIKLRSTTEIFLSIALFLIPAIAAIIILYSFKKRNQYRSVNQLIDQ